MYAFRMAQEQVSAGLQASAQPPDKFKLGLPSKVNDHVTAEDHINGFPRHDLIVHEVHSLELNE